MRWLFALCLLASCADKTTQRNTVVNGSNSNEKGTVVGQLQIDADAPAASISGANVAVQDHPEIAAKTKTDGSFQIENAPAGTINIIVTATATGLAGAAYGVKVDAVKVKPKEKTDIGKQDFKKTGRVSGLVTFFDNPNNLELSGSDVYVPGTDFIAKTDSNGSFVLDGLPEGSYTLKMQHTGFSTTTLEEVAVVSDELTDLGTVPLSLALGPEGSINLQKDLVATIGGKSKKILQSRTVAIELIYDGDAALMKVSDDPTFLNTTWMPVKKSMNWTFTSDGEKSLYVTYSDLNGLESSPFSDSVIIDTELPKISSVQIMEGWAQTATTAIYLDLVGSDSGSGISQVMLSNDVNFTGAVWQTYSSRLSWETSGGNGVKTVYAKVKDYAGQISTVSTDSINKGSYTLIHNTTYTNKVTFYKEQSPYLVTDSLTFSGDVEVRAGSSIYIADQKMVTVKGVFTSKGTATEEVLLSVQTPAVNCSMMGTSGFYLDLSQTLPGVSNANFIEYTRVKIARQIIMNGGTLRNNNFDSSICTTDYAGTLTKTGLDTLIIQSNTFTKWKKALEVNTGIGNTSFTQNTGSISQGFSQAGEATGTIVQNNTIQWLGGTTVLYYIEKGSFVLSGNTWTGTIQTGYYVNASGTITLGTIDFGNAEVGFSVNGASTVTVSGYTTTSCAKVFQVTNGGAIIASNITASGCEKIVEHGYAATGVVNISNSTLSFSRYLAYSPANTSTTTTVNTSTITCSNGSGICDFFYKEPMDGDVDNFSMTNSTINCTLANNCRGFTFEKSYVSPRAMTFNLDVRGNTYVGKAINSDLDNNIIETSTTTLNDAEIRIFEIGPDITVTAVVQQ